MPSTMQQEMEAKGIKARYPHSFSKYPSYPRLSGHLRDNKEGKFGSCCLRMSGSRAERQQKEINI